MWFNGVESLLRAVDLLVTREILQLLVALQVIDLFLLFGSVQVLLDLCGLVGGGERVGNCQKRGPESRKNKRERGSPRQSPKYRLFTPDLHAIAATIIAHDMVFGLIAFAHNGQLLAHASPNIFLKVCSSAANISIEFAIESGPGFC